MSETSLLLFLFIIMGVVGLSETLVSLGEGKAFLRMAKDFAKSFYHSEAWKKTRVAFAISKGWLCEDCLAAGIYTPGKVVHHITKLTPQNIHNPEISLGWKNLRLVCQDCHAKEHKSSSTERYFFDENGNVCPPFRENEGWAK